MHQFQYEEIVAYYVNLDQFCLELNCFLLSCDLNFNEELIIFLYDKRVRVPGLERTLTLD